MSFLASTQSRQVFTVSEITSDIRGLLEDNFASVWISGEVSNFTRAASGHFYFNLKDETSQITAVMFRGANSQLKFDLEEGLEIIVHGRVTVYEPRGQHQIIVDSAEPKGMGALQLAFEQLKKKLASQGVFDERYKKTIPSFPQKIGIVTSAAGAALHDMITVTHRRYPNMDIVVHPTLVQGEGAAEQIAQAIANLNQRYDIDVMIVGRGGGSIEDLWAFNEEKVVRAIFDSRIPIISAVGHETDYTLSDLVADLRAPTPSAAAELAVPEKQELLDDVIAQRQALIQAMQHGLMTLRQTLDHMKVQIKDPTRLVEMKRLRLEELTHRFVMNQKQYLTDFKYQLKEMKLRMPDMKQVITHHHLKLGSLTKRMQSLSPYAILKRGYSLVFKKGTDTPLKTTKNLSPGGELDLRLSDGQVAVVVSKVEDRLSFKQ